MAVSKRALVLGAAGFIGNHLVKLLKNEGYWVRGIDRAAPPFSGSAADEFVLADLRDKASLSRALDRSFDEVYQLAAEMGGAGYIFRGENDFDIFLNSARINLNTVEACAEAGVGRLFFSSSACIYNQKLQTQGQNFRCRESDAYPAFPDSEYGWEKLFAERLFSLLGRHSEFEVRIGRLHNVYGPEGTWRGGREKAPAAVCRKVAEAPEGGSIQVWGDGTQIRSFLFIDDCLDGITQLMRSNVPQPLNIGSDEFVSITRMTELVIELSGKTLSIEYVPGPTGVSARSSDNTLVSSLLGWRPVTSLYEGLAKTYAWIEGQVAESLQTSARSFQRSRQQGSSC